MKSRFVALWALFTGVCLVSGFGQTLRKCGVFQAPACMAASGAQLFWTPNRVVRQASLTLGPARFASLPRFLPPLTPDNWQVSNGNWNVAGNWSAGIPTSADAVTI